MKIHLNAWVMANSRNMSREALLPRRESWRKVPEIFPVRSQRMIRSGAEATASLNADMFTL
jgi:hypothetical protein